MTTLTVETKSIFETSLPLKILFVFLNRTSTRIVPIERAFHSEHFSIAIESSTWQES